MVSVKAPEVEGLTTKLWETPSGEKRLLYLDTQNTYGLQNHTEQFADTAVNYPVGYAGEFEPKVRIDMPIGENGEPGEVRRGAVVLRPEVTKVLTEKQQGDKLEGEWAIPFPLDTRGTENRTGELAMGNYIQPDGKVRPEVIIIDGGLQSTDRVTIPFNFPLDVGVTYDIAEASNKIDKRMVVSGLANAGYTPEEDSYAFRVHIPYNSVFPPHVVDNEKYYPLGTHYVSPTGARMHYPAMTPQLMARVSNYEVNKWELFGFHSFLQVGEQIVFLATK
jgi:hypothetical protein